MSQTKQRVSSSVTTHFPVQEKVAVEDGEFSVENHQEEMMLSEPPDLAGTVSTHTSGDIKFDGPKKPVKASAAVSVTKKPVKAALVDDEAPTGGKIAEISNEEDPSAGYLEKETGMPVIQNASADAPTEEEEFDEIESSEEFEEEGAEGEEFDPTLASDDEFEDLAEMEDGFEPEPEVKAEEVAIPEDEEMPFDKELPTTEAAPLVDIDGLDDTDADGCSFATCANVIHIIHGNRIIASMTPAAARKAGVSDVYLSNQFQDVVAHTIEHKGIRKGLVQSGFMMAKVKIAQNKVQAKAIEARVKVAFEKKLESAAQQDKAMDQALAIAAVGINRRFFKDTPNELKAGLETELQRLGVRGGANVVRAMFAKHGVDYARAIVTLAKKLAAMPEEHRNQFADALDLTEDEHFDAPEDEDDTMPSEDLVEVEDDFEPVPASLTAALLRPAQRSGTKLSASSAAMSFLMGSQPLV